jgi:hypothetical protein
MKRRSRWISRRSRNTKKPTRKIKRPSRNMKWLPRKMKRQSRNMKKLTRKSIINVLLNQSITKSVIIEGDWKCLVLIEKVGPLGIIHYPIFPNNDKDQLLISLFTLRYIVHTITMWVHKFPIPHKSKSKNPQISISPNEINHFIIIYTISNEILSFPNFIEIGRNCEVLFPLTQMDDTCWMNDWWSNWGSELWLVSLLYSLCYFSIRQ